MTAPTSVPTWSATSKVLFSAGSFTIDQLKSQGTMIRCPELEMGANSVIPWVRPRMIACRMLRGVLPSGCETGKRPRHASGSLGRQMWRCHGAQAVTSPA